MGLTVHHGGVCALDGVDLEVAPGELVGLIGPNGAGKTTLIDAVGGFVAHRGRVLVGDQELTGLPPHRRARAGIGRTWQSVELFVDLTVRQHCEVAVTGEDVRGRVDTVLERLDLAEVADVRPTELSLGRQKLVGVARALSARPRFLLADEPAAGLDTAESAEFGRVLRGLTTELGVLLVDHDIGLVLESCDRIVVLDFGRVIASGTPAEIRDDPAVIDAYLGTAR